MLKNIYVTRMYKIIDKMLTSGDIVRKSENYKYHISGGGSVKPISTLGRIQVIPLCLHVGGPSLIQTYLDLKQGGIRGLILPLVYCTPSWVFSLCDHA